MSNATPREAGGGGAHGPAGEGGLQRLFVAIPLPDSVRLDLSRLEEPLRGISWVGAQQIHLTLRFLGDVPRGRIEGIEERLAAVRVESFILPVEGVGAFPPMGPPQVIWAGVGSGHPHLFQLRQRVDDAVLAAGVDMDVRHFQPHVTLARCGRDGSPAATSWLRRHGGFSAAPFRAREFDLCSSRLTPRGAEHALLRRFVLA
jgi:2'-5' RNA ligase